MTTTSVMPHYRISGTLASTRYACRRCDFVTFINRRGTPWPLRFIILAEHLRDVHQTGPLVKVVA